MAHRVRRTLLATRLHQRRSAFRAALELLFTMSPVEEPTASLDTTAALSRSSALTAEVETAARAALEAGTKRELRRLETDGLLAVALHWRPARGAVEASRQARGIRERVRALVP